MNFTNPQYLISAEALAAKLGQPQLRIFDVAVHLIPDAKVGYRAESGQKTYDQA
ncbi:MAG: sulfurtransferase, partial [Gammaproteobacteria bacterium]